MPPREAIAERLPSIMRHGIAVLLDTYCSDKGTFWQSKHHYGTAYHSIFGSIRESVTSSSKLASVKTLLHLFDVVRYFEHVYPVDIKTRKKWPIVRDPVVRPTTW